MLYISKKIASECNQKDDTTYNSITKVMFIELNLTKKPGSLPAGKMITLKWQTFLEALNKWHVCQSHK